MKSNVREVVTRAIDRGYAEIFIGVNIEDPDVVGVYRVWPSEVYEDDERWDYEMELEVECHDGIDCYIRVILDKSWDEAKFKR